MIDDPDDPVAEIEDDVEKIIEFHFTLFGCDDPACAVASSDYGHRPKKRSWWQRLWSRTPRPTACQKQRQR